MWVNKCIWQHGFLFFGKEYPKEKNAKFTKQLGAFVINIFARVMHICVSTRNHQFNQPPTFKRLSNPLCRYIK